MRALLKLTWLEIKIFVREPMGVFGTVGIPVLVFLIASRLLAGVARAAIQPGGAVSAVLPVLASILMALSAISSLVTIIRSPRRRDPQAAACHASVADRDPFGACSREAVLHVDHARNHGAARSPLLPTRCAGITLFSYAVALTFTTWAILSIGFLIASIVPTARFAQPLAALILYPMVALSGLFFPLDVLPQSLKLLRAMPLAYAVSLLDGIWRGEGWSAHFGEVADVLLRRLHSDFDANVPMGISANACIRIVRRIADLSGVPAPICMGIYATAATSH